MSKSLHTLQTEIVAQFKEYEKQGTKPWTHDIAANDLSYQIGSLSKVLMQMRNERYDDGLTEQELKAKAADELADIMAEVLFIAHELDIDLYQAWEDMLGSDQKKIRERT